MSGSKHPECRIDVSIELCVCVLDNREACSCPNLNGFAALSTTVELRTLTSGSVGLVFLVVFWLRSPIAWAPV